LPRIDLNSPRPIEQVPMRNRFPHPPIEGMAEGKRKAEQDRIWKLIEQTSESA
jgi:hypothetical protein